MRFPPLLAFVLPLLVSGLLAAEPLRVACIGDSITSGWGLANAARDAYPVQLGRFLGPDHEIVNCAASATALLKRAKRPYWDTPGFARVSESAPAIVVLLLGTNDAHPDNWSPLHADFSADAAALLEHLQNLPSRPRVLIVLPPPVHEPNSFGIAEGNAAAVRRALRELAAARGLPVVDLPAAFADRPELFKDGVHPTPEGARLLAQTVASAIAAEAFQ